MKWAIQMTLGIVAAIILIGVICGGDLKGNEMGSTEDFAKTMHETMGPGGITISKVECDRLVESQRLLESLRGGLIPEQTKRETLWIVDDLSRILEVLSKMDVSNRLVCKARDYVVEKAINMIIEIILKEIK